MSDDDEDYMSDAFLKQCGDARPGLVPQHVARRHQQDKKERLANKQSRQKPRAAVEREKRTEGLGTALPSTNKGFSLLQKMGYRPGMVLGKSGTGRAEPVPVEVKLGRGGLGREADMKRKAHHKQELMRDMSLKKQKMAARHKQQFLDRMNEKFAERNLEKDVYESQKVCEQLDRQADIDSPHETFFWPEALLPQSHSETPSVDPEEPLDRLEPGYSGYVQDTFDGDDDEELVSKPCNLTGIDSPHETFFWPEALLPQSHSETPSVDPEEPLDRLESGYSRYVQDTFDGDDDEELVSKPCNLTVEEQLDVLTIYLRTKHKYCIWCGTKYDDKDDLVKHCPGNTAELHSDL